MENVDSGAFGGEGRLKKAIGSRTDRGNADVERIAKDGTALTMEERRRALRSEMNQEVLPTPPSVPGWHFCWLSTTNAADPIYKRIQLGYSLVKASDVPGFGNYRITGGEYDGSVACNEMILARIPEELYQEIMLINHFEKPNEEEELLRANLPTDKDSSGKRLVHAEGFGSTKPTRTPVFQ